MDSNLVDAWRKDGVVLLPEFFTPDEASAYDSAVESESQLDPDPELVSYKKQSRTSVRRSELHCDN